VRTKTTRSLLAQSVGDTVIMEERSDGILLRPLGTAAPKLSWEETARAMAAERENWTAWDVAVADGLNETPWDESPARRVAEPKPKGTARRRPKGR